MIYYSFFFLIQIKTLILRSGFICLCVLSFCFSTLYGQSIYEKDFNYKEGVLQPKQIDLIDDINSLKGNQKLDKLVDLLSTASISDTVKLTLLHIHMNEDNLSHPAFNSWLFENIGFRVDRNVYTPQSFLQKDVYLVLKFLVQYSTKSGFTPADLVKSKFFARCNLFETWYEKMMLRFLLAEFFISEMGSDYKSLEEIIEDRCAKENFKAVSKVCGT